MKKTFIAMSIVYFLTACGGGSSDNSSSSSNSSSNGGSTVPADNLKTGILTDSPIGNIRYETSSGVKGSTNTKGEFKYQAGDKISFYLGDILLGKTDAQAYITPIQLSEDENVRTNLLILLQSLDSDQDLSNGISISDTAIAALKDKTINLSLPSISFEQDQTLLQVLQSTNSTLINAEQAKENFFDSFIEDNAGTWVMEDKAQNTKVVLYIDGITSGAGSEKRFNFIFGQVGPQDSAGSSGIEVGELKWNPVSAELSRFQDFQIDTNGEWGFSNPSAATSLNYGAAANTLVYKEGNTSYTFNRVANIANSLVGTWKSDNQLATFFNDGSYIFIETTANDCGSAGIESGAYSAANGVLRPTSFQYDTNGCSGLVDSSYSPPDLDQFSYTLEGLSAVVQYQDEDPVSFTRF